MGAVARLGGYAPPMAEPFKNLINHRTAQLAAFHLHKHWPEFSASAFVQQAGTGLEALELKARAMHLADAFQAHLPSRFDQAADLVEAALAAPVPVPFDDKKTTVRQEQAQASAEQTAGQTASALPAYAAAAGEEGEGLAGWVVWSLGEWVARSVAADAANLPRALQCLHALTQRLSAEFAIRPLIRDFPDQVLPVMQSWCEDPSPHVRRLASEGSRPRLPWGLRLQALVQDPRPTLPILERLQDDPSAYVRRSVANHLNDIAKDHPDVLVNWMQQWLPNAPRARISLLRHASRSLLKAGHAKTLAAWGLDQALQGSLQASLSQTRVPLGNTTNLQLRIQAAASAPAQTLEVDYALSFPGARGSTRRKVFKGWKLQLAPGEFRQLERALPLKPVSSRVMVVGEYFVEIQINGQTQDRLEFQVNQD